MNIREQLSHDLLNCPYEGLTAQKKSVIDLIADQRPTGLGPELGKQGSYWDRTADSVARIGGSWGFIFTFAAILLAWVASNLVLAIWGRAFDPYPFIFLNLVLSTVAALQAPIIMMSQNRQAVKDRAAAEHDYVVNLRAELEIMLLHDKLDALRDKDILAQQAALSEQLKAMTAEIAALRSEIRK
jgi:uncharacterized membrane protein